MTRTLVLAACAIALLISVQQASAGVSPLPPVIASSMSGPAIHAGMLAKLEAAREVTGAPVWLYRICRHVRV